VLIKLKVHPASKTVSLTRKAADSFEVWVRSPAKDGQANREALAALSEALGTAAGLHIVKGATSPNKIVKVLG
jgi:uncharacterized protein (TIGR00251 family)